VNPGSQKKEALTQTRLQELLDYDPATGFFTWRVARQRIQIGARAECACRPDGYYHIRADGKLYLSHRLAWLYTYGRFPAGRLDHKDRDRENNRIKNLREVTPPQNNMNVGLRQNNRSGYKGVYWNKSRNKFSAQIGFRRKLAHIGYFETARMAALAYDYCARRVFGEFALTNRMLGLLDCKPALPPEGLQHPANQNPNRLR
jgi:hypothetical protein